MTKEFDLVALCKPKCIAFWSENQETFWPKIEMDDQTFEALFKYCKGDWSDKKVGVIEYYKEIYVRPSAAVTGTPAEQLAKNTLELTGIDRLPKKVNVPSKAVRRDPRWQKRKAAWGKAERAFINWGKNPSLELCDQIAQTAHSTGFYSIWVQKFIGEPAVLAEIKAQFLNTYEPVVNPAGGYTLRSLTSRY